MQFGELSDKKTVVIGAANGLVVVIIGQQILMAMIMITAVVNTF